MTTKGIAFRFRWKGNKIDTWIRRCLKCDETKIMIRGNFICSDCKRSSPRDFSRIWGPEIYNIQ